MSVLGGDAAAAPGQGFQVILLQGRSLQLLLPWDAAGRFLGLE